MNGANRFLMTALALASLAGLAMAQTQTQPAQPTKSTDPVLQGPSVKEGGVPGEDRQFSNGKVRMKDRMGGEIPHRLFMKALDALRGDAAAAAVRLAPDQESKIKTVNDAYMEAVSQYRQAHKAEAQELLQELTPEDRRKAAAYLGREANGTEGKVPKLGEKAKGKGTSPDAKSDAKSDAKPDAAADDMTDAAQATDPKKSEEAKAKLRELFEGAPKPADTHAQIFAVLTDPQKTVFQKELDQLKKDIQDKAGEKRAERKVAAKDANKDIDINDPRIPDAMRARLQNMTPEQRQQALERIRERIKRGKDGGDAKPAPSTDSDVNVPQPDSK